VYQVWLNYYSRNVLNGQDSSDVFANAATHLNAIAAMGVTAIQLSPVQTFRAEPRAGTPYSVKDYYTVDPGYAGLHRSDAQSRQQSLAALKRYIDRAHRLGLRVIMDCVLHSTAPDNVLTAQHPDFYVRGRNGRLVKNQFGFAELDYDNPALRSYMIDMINFWATSVGFDGCRADLAATIPVSFWATLNNDLKKTKPSWMMIAEVSDRLDEYAGTYSGPGSRTGETYENVYAFDAIYGFDYMRALRGIVNRTASGAGLRRAWNLPDRLAKPAPAGTSVYRGVDNHDQRPRATALAGGNEGMLAATAVSFTLDGIPFIFNGQEIGDTTRTNIFFDPLYIDWRSPPHPEDARIFTRLLRLRRTNPALAHGTTAWCATSGSRSVISYLRTSADGVVLVVVNLSSRPWTGTVTAPPGQPLTGTISDLISGRTHVAEGRTLRLTLAPYTYLIGDVRA
jgi:cyclomaltodextrinase / maltogenic alpha-amylase / neopullulanase